MEPTVTRRDVVAGALAGALATAPSAAAQAGRIPFGAAANHYVLPTDQAYRAALARHCDVLVSESAMKWSLLRKQREQFDTKHGDELVAFAQRHGLVVRGHTLVWNEDNPAWLKSLTTAAQAESELHRHIEMTIRHYAASIKSWDVVNEPIADRPRNSMDLRGGVWTTLLGERHIDIAFRAAHAAAPAQQRVLNEYGIEHAAPRDRLKRAALRRLVHDLLARGVPVTGIGLQAHLDGALDIDAEGIAAFCAEMTKLGLDVLITELDVNDFSLPGDLADRDRLVAERVRQFLSAVFAGCRPKLVCTWGLTDRYTWMPMWFKRKDGLANRPLPLDADMQPKAMHAALSPFLAR